MLSRQQDPFLPWFVAGPKHSGWRVDAPLLTSIPDNFVFSRNSTATVEDFEGLLKTAKANEARFTGARRVENLFRWSEDFSKSDWVKNNVTATKNIITFNGTVNARMYQVVGAVGTSYAMRMRVRGVSGDYSGIRFQSVGVFPNEENPPITSEWQELGGINTANSSNIGIIDRAGNVCSIEVEYIQLENVTGQTNQNPSEYVSSDVGTGSDIITNGTFEDTSSWSTISADTSITANGIKIENTSAVFGRIYQTIPTIPGRAYVVTVDFIRSAINGIFAAGTTNSVRDLAQLGVSSSGTYSIAFTAVDTTTYIQLWNNNNVATNYTEWDNLTVKLADHGAGVDSVKYFDYQNGNTVASNVVTEAQGTALTPYSQGGTMKGYYAEEQATNAVAYSYDLSSWSTATTPIITTGVYEAKNGKLEVCTVEDDEAAGFDSIYNNTGLSGNGTRAIRAYIKKDVTATHWATIRYSDITPTVNADFKIKPLDGTISTVAGAGLTVESASATEVTFPNGDVYYECEMVVTTTNAPTSIRINFFPATGLNTGFPVNDSTATGTTAIWGVQLEDIVAISGTSSYIETNGTSATRSADELYLPTGTDWADFAMSMGYISEVDGADFASTAYLRMMGSADNEADALRTFGNAGSWNFTPSGGGGTFGISKAEISKDTFSKFGYSLYQQGADAIALICKDGSEKHSETNVQTLTHSDQSIRIGYYTTQHMNGHYSDLRIYDKRVSSSRLQALTNLPVIAILPLPMMLFGF